MKKSLIAACAILLTLGLVGCVSWFGSEAGTSSRYNEPSQYSTPNHSPSSQEHRTYRGTTTHQQNSSQHESAASSANHAPASNKPQGSYSCFAKSASGAFHGSGGSRSAASGAALSKCRSGSSNPGSCSVSKCISR